MNIVYKIHRIIKTNLKEGSFEIYLFEIKRIYNLVVLVLAGIFFLC